MAQWFGNDELSSMDLQYDNPYQTFTPQYNMPQIPKIPNMASMFSQELAKPTYFTPNTTQTGNTVENLRGSYFGASPLNAVASGVRSPDWSYGGVSNYSPDNSGSNYWKSLTEGIGGASWGDIGKYGLMVGAMASPLLTNLFTNTNQQRDDYANWLSQFNQTQAQNQGLQQVAQGREDAATKSAIDTWTEKSALPESTRNAYQALGLSQINQMTKELEKRASAAGMSNRTGLQAKAIQTLMPELTRNLMNFENSYRSGTPSPSAFKSQTLSPYYMQSAPYANLPATTSVMGQYAGALGNIANYGLGQMTANVFASPYQQAMTEYIKKLGNRIV